MARNALYAAKSFAWSAEWNVRSAAVLFVLVVYATSASMLVWCVTTTSACGALNAVNV